MSNRTKKKAENLKNLFNEINILEWGDLPKFDMIINATTLGLNKVDKFGIDFSQAGQNKLFYDIIYAPFQTEFSDAGNAKGNSIEFGSLNQGRRNTASFSNTVRAVIAAGSEGYLTSMEYMTASTGGNTTDFGNLQIGRSQPAGGCNSTRGLVSGGTDPNNKLTSIESVEIATTGNAVDFGEMGYGRNASMSASDSHGGLGGY